METFKEILEVIYFISGPALVVIVYLGLSQIKVAREQVEAQRKATRINAKRDALKITSEQIMKYGSEVIPLQNVFNEKVKSEEIKFFTDSKVKITGREIQVKPCADDNEVKKLKSLIYEFTSVMNAMEGFSVFFTSGVADEKVAFRSLSSTYCYFVKELLPLLVLVEAGNKRFTATMQLFHIWYSRLESENLEKQKEELERKIKSNKTQTIEIIGEDS